MMSLNICMAFAKWFFETMLPDVLYHGTPSGNSIRATGFQLSTSGFGQRSLLGVALSPEKSDAIRYAYAHYRSKDGDDPEILYCRCHAKNLIDVRGCRGCYDIWVKLGYDLENDPQARKFVQTGNGEAPFFLTRILIQMGYDGAIVDNTLDANGPYEICVFYPKDIEVIGAEPLEIPSQGRYARPTR